VIDFLNLGNEEAYSIRSENFDWKWLNSEPIQKVGRKCLSAVYMFPIGWRWTEDCKWGNRNKPKIDSIYSVASKTPLWGNKFNGTLSLRSTKTCRHQFQLSWRLPTVSMPHAAAATSVTDRTSDSQTSTCLVARRLC